MGAGGGKGGGGEICMSVFYVLNPFPKLTRPDHDALLTAYISDSIIDTDVKIGQNVDSSTTNFLSKFETDIFYSLETIRFSVKFKPFSLNFL